MRTIAPGFIAIGFILYSTAATAAATPAQKCESGKNGAAGQYSLCVQKAQAKFLSGGEVDTARYDESVLACGEKLGTKWLSLEEKAEGQCPTTGDATDIRNFLDDCAASVEGALGGGVLQSDLATCNAELATCNTDLSSTDADLANCNTGLATCSTGLATCNTGLATCNNGLATCNTDLSSTNSDLASCNTGLATCNTDLSSTNSDLASCNTDLSATNTDLSSCNTDLSSTNSDLASCNTDLGTCETDLATCQGGGGGGGGGLPATGQTLCYDNGGSVIACAGSGQDGAFQASVARSFTDNGNGTVTDNATGLTWEKLSDDDGLHDKDSFYTWEVSIVAKIDELNYQNFGGHNDWRMPNRRELDSITNLQAYNPATFTAFNNGCVPGCTVLECSCTRPEQYWTSTSYQHLASIAWTVQFSDGFISSVAKTDSKFVRAVRGGV